MNQKLQYSREIGARQIVRSGIILGLVGALPMGVLQDFLDAQGLSTSNQTPAFANIWLYAALSALGSLLIWALPNSLAIFEQGGRRITLWPLTFIWIGTSRLFISIANHNVSGAFVNLGFIVFGLIFCATYFGLRRRAKMKSIL